MVGYICFFLKSRHFGHHHFGPLKTLLEKAFRTLLDRTFQSLVKTLWPLANPLLITQSLTVSGHFNRAILTDFAKFGAIVPGFKFH